MNQYSITAFFNELEKIADWSLAGPRQMNSYGRELMIPTGGPQVQTSPSQLVRHIQNTESAVDKSRQAVNLRQARMQEMLQSGQWNPATHNVDAHGNLVPKRPAPAQASRTSTAVTKASPAPAQASRTSTAVTKASPAPVSRTGTAIKPSSAAKTQILPRGNFSRTVISGPPPAVVPSGGASRAVGSASKLTSRLSRGLGRLGRLGRVGAGIGAMGLAGYGAGQLLESAFD